MCCSSLPPVIDPIASRAFVAHPILSVSYARTKSRPATSISSFHLVHQHLANNNRYHYNHLGFVCIIRPPGGDARSPETGVCFTYVHLMRVVFFSLSPALSSTTPTSFTVLAFFARLPTLFIPSWARGRSPFHSIPYHITHTYTTPAFVPVFDFSGELFPWPLQSLTLVLRASPVDAPDGRSLCFDLPSTPSPPFWHERKAGTW